MGRTGFVCAPSILHDPQGSREGGKRGSGSTVSSPILAKEALISSVTEVVRGNP